MFREFKEFALKGNAITLAIGVVMGAAFNSIIAAMVDGIFTPLIGVLLGGVDLSSRRRDHRRRTVRVGTA